MRIQKAVLHRQLLRCRPRMSQTTVIPLLAVFSSALVASVLSTCDRRGPADCDFHGRHTCGWLAGSGWRLSYERSGQYDNYFLRFVGDDTGQITSRRACSTRGSTHCLTFQYRFQTDDVIDLNVVINNSERGKEVVWTQSSSPTRDWNVAWVPVTSDADFSVIIEARRHDGQRSSSGYVSVDSIRYKKQTCHVYPANAKPAPTSTTTASKSSRATRTTSETTESTTSTEPTTTTTPDQGGTSGQITVPARSQNNFTAVPGAVIRNIIIVILFTVLRVVFKCIKEALCN